MHDNYINNFEWFMRADDDIFVRGDKLEKFLRSVNSSVPHFIVHAGIGKKEDIGELFLNRHENYCMGGPGILLSHTTLRHVGPHVHSCMDNLLTTHEDVEVGRCVRRYTGLSCTWAFEVHNNFTPHKGFTTAVQNTELSSFLSYTRSASKTVIFTKGDNSNGKNAGTLKPTDSITRQGMIPSLTKYKPKVRDEVLAWDYLSTSTMSHRNLNPKRAINTPLKHALEDNINQALQIMNRNARQKGGQFIIKTYSMGIIEYGGADIEVIYADGPFNKAKALDLGMFQLSEDSLLFFIDVDIIFDRDVLLRIRYNTIKNIQVYYPIVFSQYNPSLICSISDSCDIKWTNLTSDHGYWRSFGYGMVSTFKRDLISVGGLDTSIKGWGKEDVALNTKFVGSNLTIFRSIDPRLVHVFHQVICDTKLKKDQYDMCKGTEKIHLDRNSRFQILYLVYQISFTG
ncbi:CHSY [Mytilus edulis]|uniref:Hexosyltransferase n=1 Tax=Mytilus edulis TaxID=6550 RepID=A0A8S3TH87_MYTED|nr:CHSY [Mytilus edulis]